MQLVAGRLFCVDQETPKSLFTLLRPKLLRAFVLLLTKTAPKIAHYQTRPAIRRTKPFQPHRVTDLLDGRETLYWLFIKS